MILGLAIVICIDGKAELDGLILNKGETALVPHGEEVMLKSFGETVLVY